MRQQQSSSMMSGLFGIAGSFLGGPAGGMLGKSFGKMFQ
jgi:hypothetical protein